ncbi:MAG: aspartyl protease family protein [Sphingomonas sp.]
MRPSLPRVTVLLFALLSDGAASSSQAPAPRWPSGGTLVATGSIRTAGLDGAWRSTVDLVDGRFDTRSDLGVYRIGDIYDGRTRWRLEPSGGHHPLDSDFAQATARTEAWLARFGWLQAGHAGAAFSAPVGKSADGRIYLIRTATPSGGRPVLLWFDAATGDLMKSERRGWMGPIVTRYGDYRTAYGQRLPFRMSDDDQTIKVTHYTIARGRSDARFAPPPQPDDTTLAAGGTTVPAPIFPQLVVEASINGSAPMGFVFDTGGHSVLTPAAADALGLTAVGGSQTGGTGTGTITQRDTRVKTLRIGDAVLHDQHFFVLSLGYPNMEQGAKPPLAGLLGLEIAERFIVRMNYRAGTLTLLPRDTPLACRGNWQTVRFTDDMPTVTGSLDGTPAAFTIDTGSTGALQVYDHWARRHNVAERYRHGVETLSYGAGGASRNWVSHGGEVRLGDATIRKPLVRITDDKNGIAQSITEAGNLGTGILAHYTLTFDYARSQVCFDYVPGYVTEPFNRSGMRAIKIDPDVFAVSLVNPGSPAALAGLRKDDLIVSVEGRSARLLSGGDLSRILTRTPGTRVKLDYLRDGNIHHAEIALREMLP